MDGWWMDEEREREREESTISQNRTIRRFTIPKSQNETDRQKDVQEMGSPLLTVEKSFAIEKFKRK